MMRPCEGCKFFKGDPTSASLCMNVEAFTKHHTRIPELVIARQQAAHYDYEWHNKFCAYFEVSAREQARAWRAVFALRVKFFWQSLEPTERTVFACVGTALATGFILALTHLSFGG